MKNQKAIKVLFFSTFMALSRIFILKNRKATFYVTLRFFSKSRSDVIRTRDLYVPNVALYQAEPHCHYTNPHHLMFRLCQTQHSYYIHMYKKSQYLFYIFCFYLIKVIECEQ